MLESRDAWSLEGALIYLVSRPLAVYIDQDLKF